MLDLYIQTLTTEFDLGTSCDLPSQTETNFLLLIAGGKLFHKDICETFDTYFICLKMHIADDFYLKKSYYSVITNLIP